jgi:hypothetical protein
VPFEKATLRFKTRADAKGSSNPANANFMASDEDTSRHRLQPGMTGLYIRAAVWTHN